MLRVEGRQAVCCSGLVQLVEESGHGLLAVLLSVCCKLHALRKLTLKNSDGRGSGWCLCGLKGLKRHVRCGVCVAQRRGRGSVV